MSGQFYIVDSKTIFIEDFNYDGGGPGKQICSYILNRVPTANYHGHGNDLMHYTKKSFHNHVLPGADPGRGWGGYGGCIYSHLLQCNIGDVHH